MTDKIKVVLSNVAFLKPTDELVDRFQRNLVYEGASTFTGAPPKFTYSYGPVMKDTYWIPVERLDMLQGHELEIIDKRVKVPVKFPEPTFTLRKDQQEVLDGIEDSALLNAAPGWGKSIAALAVAKKLGQKTLIVCTTTTIRDMWIREIEKFLGFKAGMVGSGKNDTSQIITVGNIQTLTRNADKFKSMFGLIVFDECFDYETLIKLADGSTRKIGAIVNGKETPLVKSFNLSTGKWEVKKVLNHFKNPQKMLRKLQLSNSTLKCTENHNLFIESSTGIIKKQAKDLVIGDKVVSEVRHKDSYPVLDWNLLIALAIGDGNLGKTKEGIRLRVTHGEAQLDYLDSKTFYMGECTFSKGKSGYCDNSVYYAQTKTFKDTIGIYNMLYGSGTHKSSFPKELFNYLDWRTLAYIIMDDGSYQNGNITLSLCEVDVESLERFCKHFFLEDNLAYTVYTCKKGHNYIRIRKSGVEKVKEHCLNEFHPDMLYKLGIAYTIEYYSPVGTTLFKDYTTTEYLGFTEVPATGGSRYNIEVEDNHNYIANGKLVSNCHHTPATTFTKLLLSSKARYKLGLSGTLHRKDGMHVVFKDYFGFNILQPKINNTMPPTVHRYTSGVAFPGNSIMPWADRVTSLTQNEMYRKEILALAALYVQLGHKVILVSDRVEFLEFINENVDARSALFIGSVGLEDREQVLEDMTDGKLDMLCASQGIFSEGVSQNNLSCMILGTPISDNRSLLSQLAGRIMRKNPGKLNPVLVDMILKGDSARGQANKRKSIFKIFGWDMISIDLQGLINRVMQLRK